MPRRWLLSLRKQASLGVTVTRGVRVLLAFTELANGVLHVTPPEVKKEGQERSVPQGRTAVREAMARKGGTVRM